MPLTIDVVSTSGRLAPLAAEWTALGTVAACPFSRHEWMDSALGAYERAPTPAVVVARQDGVISGIAPLVIDRSAGPPVLRSIDHYIGEFNTFMYRDEASLRALCDAVIALGLPIDLRLLGSDRAVSLLGANGRPRAVVARRPAKPVRAAPLAGGWAEFEAAMPAGSRRYLQRRRKIARRWGEPELRVVQPTPEDVDLHLQSFVRVEAAGWKTRGGTSIQEDPRMARFVSAMGRRFAARGALRLFFLHLGDAIAAARLTILDGNRLWEIKIGYDEAYAQCSPGLLLMHETLRHACELGIDGYEYLGVAEAWQQHWPHEERPCVHVRSYPASVAGLRLLAGAVGASLAARSTAAMRAVRQRLLRTGDEAGESGGAGR